MISNLVPRVLSLSLRENERERTLVVAGHVITCVNKLRVRLICYFYLWFLEH